MVLERQNWPVHCGLPFPPPQPPLRQISEPGEGWSKAGLKVRSTQIRLSGYPSPPSAGPDGDTGQLRLYCHSGKDSLWESQGVEGPTPIPPMGTGGKSEEEAGSGGGQGADQALRV